MSSLGEFSNRIEAIAATIERRGPAIKRLVAGTALQTVVMATPVGNVDLWGAQARSRARPGYVGGRARANWLVGVSSPRSEATDDKDAGGSNTITQGKSAIDASGSSVIYLSNNLPYIVPLNEGHSHQAPSGFVETAVQAAINAINGARITSDN